MPRFYVSIDYGTKRGNPGTWSGDVEADDATAAYKLGEEKMRRARSYIGKVFGGSASQYPEPASVAPRRAAAGR